ncbi:MAG TPA: restriction endonuclease subunit S [Caldithrix abyssi]|uniref:Restriction endonuclease subunit S n=1 Tax=Caldithrix abyssi TaxID=187145 RepID=A0A7V4U0D5_CALAY|nr:restriction endonuclease subunit S [Caldithrix abyssi]
MKHINRNEFLSTKIPLPPLEEQKRIAAILDKADALRQKRRESIRLLDEFLRSVFLDMFGDDAEGKNYVNLEKLCFINPSKLEIKKSELELEASFLPMSSISEDGLLDLSKTGKVSELKKGFTYFREGDVLFAKITPSMENGKGAIAENLLNQIGFGTTELHVLRPKHPYKSSWLYTLLSSKKIRKKAASFMTGTAGQQRVPENFLRKLKVPPPDLEKMAIFDKIFYAVKNEKEKMKESNDIFKELFNSLVQRAFRGEL